MGFAGRVGILAAGCIMLLAVPVLAQEIHATAMCPIIHDSVADGAFAGFAAGLPLPPCSEPSLPPGSVVPLKSKPPSQYAEPAEPPLSADLHLASTELGFATGVGPAPGRAVTYHGQKYRVTDIEVTGGGPFFSGGSAFVISVNGKSLIVGLKSIEPGSTLDPDRFDPSVVN